LTSNAAWLLQNPQERYNSSESVPKKEIPIYITGLRAPELFYGNTLGFQGHEVGGNRLNPVSIPAL
jgi:hypothetical protein